jgi:hypothetical protein
MFHRRPWLLVVAFLVTLCVAASAPAQNMAFTYQGRITSGVGGSPSTGPVNLVVTLFAAEIEGDPIGTQTINGVPLLDGIFTVTLNAAGEFSANPFAAGSDRWVEITVDGVTLAPRQKLSVAPMAAFSAAPWVMSGTNLSYTAGNVGIGTTTPDRPLTLNQASTTIAGLRSSQLMSFRIDDETRWHVNMVAPGPLATNVGLNFAETGISDYRLFLARGGNVGIGTSLPSGRLEIAGGIDALIIRPPQMVLGDESRITFRDPDNATPSTALVFKKAGYPNLSVFSPFGSARLGVNTREPAQALDVRGEIAFGSSGQYFAVAGTAPLRTLQAVVNGSNGTLFSGQGMTVTRTGVGRYSVAFTTTFTNTPAVTVSAVSIVPVMCTTDLLSISGFNVHTFNTIGVPADANFSIIAVGPR